VQRITPESVKRSVLLRLSLLQGAASGLATAVALLQLAELGAQTA
jgi:hypothetical protein